MGHNINITDGQASIMFVGDLPWHKLGKALKTPPKTALEAIKAANLDWDVELKNIFFRHSSRYLEVSDKKVLIRKDRVGKKDGAPFAMVGNNYQILQNRDAFHFFDPFIDAGHGTYETAGSLGRGERVWVLVKMKEDLIVKKNDIVKKYLLLVNGHDGMTSLKILFTPVRVVCQNTLNQSLDANRILKRISHLPGLSSKLEHAQSMVRSIIEVYADLDKQFIKMANTPMNPENTTKYIEDVFPYPKAQSRMAEEKKKIITARIDLSRRRVERLVAQGIGNDKDGIRGTVWAAYNAVTEYVDHHVPYKNPSFRMQSLIFGDGSTIKQRAMDLASNF